MNPAWALVSVVQSVMSVVGIGVVGWCVVAFTRARHSKPTGPIQLASGALGPLEDRMERLERTTEAIALQVERIAEGQRFVTKLLSETEHRPPRLGAPR